MTTHPHRIELIPVSMRVPNTKGIYQRSKIFTQSSFVSPARLARLTCVKGLFSPINEPVRDIAVFHQSAIPVNFYAPPASAAWHVRADEIAAATAQAWTMSPTEPIAAQQPTLIDLVEALPAWPFIQVQMREEA